MPLLTELGTLGNDWYYKHVAPSGALAVQHQLFNRTRPSLCAGGQKKGKDALQKRALQSVSRDLDLVTVEVAKID
jgi:hypothetical protein